MKTVALLPFKNEAWILRTYLSTIRPLVDEIVAIDDGSRDESRALVEEVGGIVRDNTRAAKSGWSEYHIREELLRLGRERCGTHFICLDADEAFTAPFIQNGAHLLRELHPGQKLRMQWLALWKSCKSYRHDGSVWSNNFKDFAFCDDGTSHHEYAFLGVGRTPGANSADRLITVQPSHGAVLHFQFVAWGRFQMKQAWYRCGELIEKPRSVREINDKYRVTLDDDNVGLAAVPEGWLEGICVPGDDAIVPTAGWHLEEMRRYFDEYGIDFFESLDIWHIPELKTEFVRRTGRAPRRRHQSLLITYLSRIASAAKRLGG